MRTGLFGNHSGLSERLAAAQVEILTLQAATTGSDASVAVTNSERLEDLILGLDHPRLFLLDLAPGPEVDELIDRVYVVMEPGDVVIDPSGSYWGDTLRRFRRMRHRSIYYVDSALCADRNLALAAGDKRGVQLATPLLERLVPGGTVARAGEAGAAHFAASVLAGVDMAVDHAVSEARQLLEAFPNAADAESVAAALWRKRQPASLAAAWLLDDAVRLHAAIPLLAQGVMLELASALDDHRPVEVPPRLGGFVHPDEIL